jgi:hypothetical protein
MYVRTESVRDEKAHTRKQTRIEFCVYADGQTDGSSGSPAAILSPSYVYVCERELLVGILHDATRFLRKKMFVQTATSTFGSVINLRARTITTLYCPIKCRTRPFLKSFYTEFEHLERFYREKIVDLLVIGLDWGPF